MAIGGHRHAQPAPAAGVRDLMHAEAIEELVAALVKVLAVRLGRGAEGNGCPAAVQQTQCVGFVHAHLDFKQRVLGLPACPAPPGCHLRPVG